MSSLLLPAASLAVNVNCILNHIQLLLAKGSPNKEASLMIETSVEDDVFTLVGLPLVTTWLLTYTCSQADPAVTRTCHCP